MAWVLQLLKLLSIVIQAFFASLALVVAVKDTNGQLTLAGKFAVVGVVVGAVLASSLYFLELRSAAKSKAAAEAKAREESARQLTPLGPMRVRIMLRVPADEFSLLRERVLSKHSTWDEPYPIPLLPEDLTGDKKADNFFGTMMVSFGARSADASDARRPQFDSLTIFTLVAPADGGPNVVKNGHTAEQNPIQLWYDKARDCFRAELTTGYFDDFTTSGSFMSFRDFAGGTVRLAFNLREKAHASVDFLDLQSRAGRRRIFVDGFTSDITSPDAFVATVESKALMD